MTNAKVYQEFHDDKKVEEHWFRTLVVTVLNQSFLVPLGRRQLVLRGFPLLNVLYWCCYLVEFLKYIVNLAKIKPRAKRKQNANNQKQLV